LSLARTLSHARYVLPTLVACGTAALLVQNFIILRENRELRSRPALPLVAEGKRVRDLKGLNLEGKTRKIELTGPALKLLVIAFSPNCPFCRANQKSWQRLEREVRQRGWEVVWLSRDPVDVTRPYCLEHGIPFWEAIAEPTVQTYFQLGLASVPGTIAIGPDGVVRKVWSGEFRSDSWSQLSAYFGLGDLKSQSRGRVLGADFCQLARAISTPRPLTN